MMNLIKLKWGTVMIDCSNVSALGCLDDVVDKIKKKELLSFSDQCVLMVSCVSMADNLEQNATSNYINSFTDRSDIKLHPLIDKFLENLPTQEQVGFMSIGAYFSGKNPDGSDIDSAIKKEPSKTIEKTYVVRKSGTSEIKIGRSMQAERRIKTLKTQSGCNLDTLIIINKNIETAMHRKFSHLRTIGEWFDDSSMDIQDFISKGEQWVIEKFVSEGII